MLSLPALLVAGVALSGCGNDRRPGGGVIGVPKDSGVNTNQDTGTVMVDSGNNPVDTGVPPVDTGVPPADTGVPPPDSGMPPDTGMPPMGECLQASDCTNIPNAAYCLFPNQQTGTLDPCAGQATCQCWQGCDPWTTPAQSGCGGTEACGRAGTTTTEGGLCFPDTGGGTQNQPCTAQFDAMGGWAGDDCNDAQNFICHGSDALDITGECSRLCDFMNNPGLCPLIDPNTTCIEIANSGGLGACLPARTDFGVSCNSPAECQGDRCDPALGNSCSQSCGVTNTCQPGGICVGIQGQLAPLCAKTCSAGTVGDPECSALNANTVCEDLGMGLIICLPRCTMDMDCGPAPATCNVATGHCN